MHKKVKEQKRANCKCSIKKGNIASDFAFPLNIEEIAHPPANTYSFMPDRGVRLPSFIIEESRFGRRFCFSFGGKCGVKRVQPLTFV